VRYIYSNQQQIQEFTVCNRFQQQTRQRKYSQRTSHSGNGNISFISNENATGKFSEKKYSGKYSPEKFYQFLFASFTSAGYGRRIGEESGEKRELTDDVKREKNCDQQ